MAFAKQSTPVAEAIVRNLSPCVVSPGAGGRARLGTSSASGKERVLISGIKVPLRAGLHLRTVPPVKAGSRISRLRPAETGWAAR